MVLAVESVFAEIGGAIGLTVAAVIWQDVFPVKLALYLPAETLPELPAIYGDLSAQLMYPVGSATRLAIQHAYGDSQQMMLIAGTAIWAVRFGVALVWRDINVKNIRQVKGNVV